MTEKEYLSPAEVKDCIEKRIDPVTKTMASVKSDILYVSQDVREIKENHLYHMQVTLGIVNERSRSNQKLLYGLLLGIIGILGTVIPALVIGL